MSVLCSIATRGRYDTTLPLTLMALIMQTRTPDKIVVFDDNDAPVDVREHQHYMYLFQMMDAKNIKWEWVFAQKKGQHHIHQAANHKAVHEGYTWVLRMDDDCVPEPQVLQKLLAYAETSKSIGAVGGAILTPPLMGSDYTAKSTGRIEDIRFEPNLQWNYITEAKSVDHLHCSFLYRAGVADYNLELSRVAHREETLFTYALKKKGFTVAVIPDANTWHLKNKQGGIRAETNMALYEHDEAIFNNIIATGDHTVVVLDCGLGDHIVFAELLPLLHNPLVFSCYPDIVPGRSIEEAKNLYGDIMAYNIYAKMDAWKWKGSLFAAFCKMYGVKP